MTCELSSAEYPEIRIALGLAGDDTTSLPNATIEARAYLPFVTRKVGAGLAAGGDDCAFSCDSGDPDYDEEQAEYVIDALVLLTAARIAEGWYRARADERITARGVGPARESFDKTDWQAHAASLMRQGLEALAGACPSAAVAYGGGASGVDLMYSDGPSRRPASETAADRALEREEELDPWGLGGP